MYLNSNPEDGDFWRGWGASSHEAFVHITGFSSSVYRGFAYIQEWRFYFLSLGKTVFYPVFALQNTEELMISKLWCWQRLLRVPETERRSSWSILKEINPDYSLGGLMLKLQYFGHLMQRADSLEKTLMLGKIEGKTRRGQQRMRWLEITTDSMYMNLSKFWEIVRDKGAW